MQSVAGRNQQDTYSGRANLKRGYGGDEDSSEMEVVTEEATGGGEAGGDISAQSQGEFCAKKPCSTPASAKEKSSQGYDLNFPLPGEEGLPCLVKVSVFLSAGI